jgi:adenosylhomocysteine nucleosidase
VDPAPQAATSHKIGVVTGLASEAAVLAGILDGEALPVQVVCAGASNARAATLSRDLVAQGCNALMSFGIAGAVSPDLDSGALVIPDDVLVDDVDAEGNIRDICPCDRRWLEGLHAALAEAQLAYCGGMLIGSQRLWRDAKDKDAIFEITEAVAIDMESGAVAAVADDAGLPFLAVRAVADRARDTLPSLVESAVQPDGRPAVGRAIAHLVRHPSEIPATLRLARQTELALARLRMLESVKEALFGRF